MNKPIMPKCPANYFGKGENYSLTPEESGWFLTESDKWEQENPEDPDGSKALAQWRKDRAEWELHHSSAKSEARVKPQLERMREYQELLSEREKMKAKRERDRFAQELTILKQRQRMRHSDISKALLVKLVRQAGKEKCTVENLVEAMLSKRIVDWRIKTHGI